MNELDSVAAHRFLASLQTSGGTSRYTESDILQMEFRQELAAGRSPRAVMAFLQLASYGVPAEDDIQAAFDLIESLQDRYAMEVAGNLLRQHGYTGYVQRDIAEVASADQVPGVVTVWVNKGVKLENGVGYPDRMIGSGFFIDSAGHFLTNYHVISSEVDPEYEGYSRVYIRPHNSSEMRIPARVLGFDPILDLALLHVPYSPEYVFPISGIQQRPPGSRVFAIGSPGGLSNTITSGIISATGRRFFQIGEAIQVDAPLNPGNSGGPIVDEQGNLVGVVFAGVPQFEGINFVIPSFWLRPILSQLYSEGQVEHSYMGLAVRKVRQGLEIIHVVLNSPAYRSGLRVGEIITAIDGQKVESLEDANSVLHTRLPGQLIQVTLQTATDSQADEEGNFASGSQFTQRIALSVRPEKPLESALTGVSHFPESLFPPLFGMTVETTGRGFFSDSFLVENVFPGTIADDSGISSQDPVSLQRWEYDEESGLVMIFIRVQKRLQGYMDSAVLLPASIETANIL